MWCLRNFVEPSACQPRHEAMTFTYHTWFHTLIELNTCGLSTLRASNQSCVHSYTHTFAKRDCDVASESHKLARSQKVPLIPPRLRNFVNDVCTLFLVPCRRPGRVNPGRACGANVSHSLVFSTLNWFRQFNVMNMTCMMCAMHATYTNNVVCGFVDIIHAIGFSNTVETYATLNFVCIKRHVNFVNWLMNISMELQTQFVLVGIERALDSVQVYTCRLCQFLFSVIVGRTAVIEMEWQSRIDTEESCSLHNPHNTVAIADGQHVLQNAKIDYVITFAPLRTDHLCVRSHHIITLCRRCSV